MGCVSSFTSPTSGAVGRLTVVTYESDLQRFEEYVGEPATPRDKVAVALGCMSHVYAAMTVSGIAAMTGLDVLSVARIVDREPENFAVHDEWVRLPYDIPPWYRALLDGRTR